MEIEKITIPLEAYENMKEGIESSNFNLDHPEFIFEDIDVEDVIDDDITCFEGEIDFFHEFAQFAFSSFSHSFSIDVCVVH